MNDTRTRELYSSPNGDRWHLCKDASGRVFVLHQANIPSGGQTSHIELGDFLTRGYGPEQQALFQMIGTLIESDVFPCLSMPQRRMGPPLRSFAADAHDCI